MKTFIEITKQSLIEILKEKKVINKDIHIVCNIIKNNLIRELKENIIDDSIKEYCEMSDTNLNKYL
jgi:hypothetical protein